MDLKELQCHWNTFGSEDPLWAILTDPAKKDNKWEIEDFFKTGEIDANLLIDDIKTINPSLHYHSALDFGCGVGRLTQALALYFDECIGVDISPSMIENARKHNHMGDKCKYVINEASNLSQFSDNSFDFVYSKLVLQHIRPKYSKEYIKEFIRIVKPGGLILFQIPYSLEIPKRTICGIDIPEKLLQVKESIFRISKSLCQNVKNNHIIRTWITKQKFQPVMEFYGIPREEVERIIEQNCGNVIKIDIDNNCPPWKGYLYFVTK